jgi:DNA helicase IV
VGLHRAAFLLYEHRELLDRDGVLVVGPNPVFLRYIAQVLPSLGEAATRQTTVERLVAGASWRVRAVDSPERARLLGDARLASVLERALRALLRRPTEDLVLGTDWGRVTLTAAAVNEAIDEILERDVAFATGRTALRTRLHRLAWQQHHAARGDGAAPPDAFDRAVRSSTDFQAAIGRIWPTTSGAVLAKRVLTNRAALAAAAEGVLSAEEQRLLVRRGARKLDDEPWTVAELVVVDEAEALVSGAPTSYGHLVVDEAQDLSPMELRALARRCPSRSMTVLGDLAQATAPGATDSWEETIVHLGAPPTASIEELGQGYRVPEPIIEVANRLLPRVAPRVRPAGSVRTTGSPPVRVAVDAERLGAAVAEVVAPLAERWSSVGVVVPGAHRDAVAGGFAEAGATFAEGIATALEEVVTLLPPPDAKGLEFDAVVVVEPAAFFADDDDTAGGRLLYIALTRAVQELAIVHASPLPPELV